MSTFLDKLKAVKDSLVLTVQMATLSDGCIASAIDDEVQSQSNRGAFDRLSDFNTGVNGSHWLYHDL